MAEVLGLLSAVQATTQLVEQAFRILSRLRKAHERQKSLVDVLTRHENELRSIKAIIGIIDDEDDLKMPSVAEELVRLRDVQTRLAKLLGTLDPKSRSKANQIARQFVQGSADEKKLSDIMNDLVQVKAMLLLRIQLVNVSVAVNVEKGLVANAVVVKRIDESLREHAQNCGGLRIAQLLKGRRPSGKYGGTVPLTQEDLRSLNKRVDDGSEDGTLVDDSGSFPRIGTERMVVRNTARNQAAQINAPVETDIWENVDRLVIRDNLAEDQSLQINYGTTFEIMSNLMDRQRNILAVPHPKRHDKVHKM